jgi:hypothetical protein
VLPDLAHQGREFGVKGRILGLQSFYPLEGLLGLGVLMPGPFRLGVARLVLDRRVDLGLLRHRVSHQPDGHLLDEVLAPGPFVVTGGPA